MRAADSAMIYWDMVLILNLGNMQRNIIINGESFAYSIVEPTALITGKEKLYLFWGIDWKQLDRMPQWDTIATIQMDGRYYTAKQVGKEMISRPGYWHIHHAGKWYEISATKPQTNTNQ